MREDPPAAGLTISLRRAEQANKRRPTLAIIGIRPTLDFEKDDEERCARARARKNINGGARVIRAFVTHWLRFATPVQKEILGSRRQTLPSSPVLSRRFEADYQVKGKSRGRSSCSWHLLHYAARNMREL